MADFTRGQHPDLTPSGDLKADVYLPPAERDFWRRWTDPSERQRLVAEMAASQRQEPEVVQRLVQGRSYGDGSNPYQGMQAYRAAIQEARSINASINGATAHVDDRDIEGMSTAEYERYFDPDNGGQPRPGVIVNYTNRAVRLDDGRPR